MGIHSTCIRQCKYIIYSVPIYEVGDGASECESDDECGVQEKRRVC